MTKVRLLLFFLLYFVPLNSFAQRNEPVIAKAYYTLTHIFDTSGQHEPKQETYVSFLGNNSMRFMSYDKYLGDSALYAAYKLTGGIVPREGKKVSSDEWYLFYGDQELYSKGLGLLGSFVLKQPFPTIEWVITSEKKVIEGYSCQKAKGSFGGREYTAWFTTDLSFSAGPWKLNGLPGLILSAQDGTGRISFEFAGLSVDKNSIEKVHWPTKFNIISYKEYQKLAEVYNKNPHGYIERKIGGSLTVNGGQRLEPRKKSVLAPDPKINFPLELEETFL